MKGQKFRLAKNRTASAQTAIKQYIYLFRLEEDHWLLRSPEMQITTTRNNNSCNSCSMNVTTLIY